VSTGVLSLGAKRPGREADHSPQSSAEVKNAWSYNATPQYVFMAWCLVKRRDFTFTFHSTLVVPWPGRDKELYSCHFLSSLSGKCRDGRIYEAQVAKEALRVNLFITQSKGIFLFRYVSI
jgi:hypothetical protein